MLHSLRRSTLFFTLLILGIAGTGYGQENAPVNIPDANLRAVRVPQLQALKWQP